MGEKLSTWTLLAVFSLLIVKGISQDLDLADAFDSDELTSPPPKVKPAGGAGGAGEVKPSLKPVKPTVKEPAKHKPKQTDFGDLNLEDALSPDNDIRGKGKDSGKGGSEFSDADLADVGNDNSYKPDKGKGGRGGSSGGHSGSDLDHTDDNYDTMAETGTIAGIVSAIAMALAGAVSGYISYQKKKLCFSIQQSLNADMVKADAPDAVVAQEPQVQQTLLQPPNTEPPTEENAV
ncbi:CD99 antigen-like protein 2 isoform X4 [Sinocyclocheilus anshuiensis]|uniref:CD99 antigen-like protein 2 n=1 Tax=Sinocyclocheilus anshuiensis TaxID=1608454 RepID=A0A671NCZ2_9TELE|nr:PREDICTED: CD99 antigen-like protein 2 isoform X4 [Sinocyclocheilus anshuiensis]